MWYLVVGLVFSIASVISYYVSYYRNESLPLKRFFIEKWKGIIILMVSWFLLWGLFMVIGILGLIKAYKVSCSGWIAQRRLRILVMCLCLFFTCSSHNQNVYHSAKVKTKKVRIVSKKKLQYRIIKRKFKWIHPYLHTAMRIKTKKYNLEMAFVSGLIHEESWGKRKAVSVSGAMGYMQVMPFHHRGNKYDLWGTYLNLEKGCAYLKGCVNKANRKFWYKKKVRGKYRWYRRYRGLRSPKELAAIYYNAGQNTNVPRYMRKYRRTLMKTYIRPIYNHYIYLKRRGV